MTFLSSELIAQKRTKLELKNAERLVGGMHKGKKVNKVIGDVKFKHQGTFMYCDSAFQYIGSNSMDAFGHVRIVDKKTQLFGDSLFYSGDNNLAEVRGDVRVIDPKSKLTTNFLDYDTEEKVGYYYGGGKIVNEDGAVLTSKKGTLHGNSDLYIFKDSVVLIKNNDRIVSDTLHYYSKSGLTEFFGPTHVYNEGNILYAEEGIYNTKTEVADFEKNAWIDSDDYIMYGDSIHYVSEKSIGHAKYDVKIFSKKDSVIIIGEEAEYDGVNKISKVYGDPYMRKKLSLEDTLYLSADTLVAIEDTINNKSNVRAYNNVLIFKGEMQGKCDSLYFSETDSTLFMYNNPIVWQLENQITSDTIEAHMKDGGVDKIFAYKNAFVISKDTLEDFNQVKGRELTAYFSDSTSELLKVKVVGNGQSIYFAREDKVDEATGEKTKELIGMNKIECSEMTVRFKESDVDNITFYEKPDARFFPFQLIEEPEKRLSRFKWHSSSRPTLLEVLRGHTPE